MQKKIRIWRLILSSLENSIPVILLYVLESKGSSPGRQGFFMALNANGDLEGSIGGGIMEHKFVEMGRERLQTASLPPGDSSLRKQIHDKKGEKDRSGMICSGEQTILIYHLEYEDEPTVLSIINSLQQYRNGTLHFGPGLFEFINEEPPQDFHYRFASESDWDYKEKTGYKNKLYIIGGGHCALSLSELMSRMDFYVTVFDDRKNLKTMVENSFAHEKKEIDNYNDLSEIVPDGHHHYIVVMTFGYRTDDIAIRALHGKKFKYMGVLGSKTKMEKLFSDYRVEGLDETYLQQIHTPIGLDIRSQTPEEIAVSIAAEIIKVKNGQRN